MEHREPVLRVIFYRGESGAEPVREWLKELQKEDRKTIGEDIKTAQFGWPLGMPLIRKMEKDLWEVRSYITDGIARTFFTVEKDTMVLLHGFVKKSQETPPNELQTARRRLRNTLGG
ncbi:MAG: type II toxin-antitoxin system RelE/ParE family toxin [Candidatus Roizmanbacteria bacterium]|nr:type II toxin-antitoxin system RelE/ParE family toxin [Candidatus Roizmanbacteria bacterium]